MDEEVRLAVLGPVELSVSGRVLGLSPSLRALVAALAFDDGRVVATDVILDRLWAEAEPRARVTLQSYVSRLRTRLGEASSPELAASVLRTRAPGYQLVLDDGHFDLQRFRSLLRRARTDPDAAGARASLDEATGLWRGPAYADIDLPFAVAERARLADQLLQARELGFELDLSLGRHHEVLEEVATLVEAEPLREGLWASYAVALYRSDRQADALIALDRARTVLRDELGVDPGPTLRDLQDRLLRQDRSLDPAPTVATTAPQQPATSPSSAPTDEVAGSGFSGIGRAALVVPPTSLIGRQDDLDRLEALLTDDVRLVTLTGFGGVGKTRLALALAHRLSETSPEQFRDGVALVPLATTEEPELVVPTLARALGHTVVAGPHASDELAAQLSGRRLLVVLDNVEHLLDAAPEVARLVAAQPGLTVVATSRAPLRVTGEQEWPVRPLDVAEVEGRPLRLDEARACAAVDLFVQRARAVVPGFALDEDNATAVARICRRLGGIPLAIELAVARLRILGTETLLSRLDDALGAGPRDLPERQRTMRATLDWSYRLLDQDSQLLYRRLSVFSGGWTMSALQALEGGTAHSALETLVEHSLVTTSWGGHDTRYSMLEPTSQHARSLLSPAEAREVHAAHAAYYVELAEQASLGFLAAAQLDWLEIVDYEHANVLHAFDWALAEDVETAGRLVWALWLYWWWRSHTAVGRRAVASVARLEGLSQPVRTRAVLASAALAFSQGDLEAAEADYGAVARLARTHDDKEPLANAVAGLGIVALARGDLAMAEAHQREAIAVGTTLGPHGYGPWITSLGHCWLGTALLGTGRRDEALVHLHEGLRLANTSGDRLAAYTTLWYLARSESDHDHDAARRYLVEGVELAQGVGDLTNLSYFLDALVSIEAAVDRSPTPDEASRHARLLGAAAAFREAEAARAISYYLPDDEARDRAAERARRALDDHDFQEAVAAGRRLPLAEAVSLAIG